jgi:hypothetical protein
VQADVRAHDRVTFTQVLTPIGAHTHINIMLETTTSPQLFTKTSASSLAAVATLGLVAYVGSKTLLPKNAKWQDRFTFIWLVSNIQ